MIQEPKTRTIERDERLSTGDAIAIVALLAFAIGWLAIWFVTGDNTLESDEEIQNGEALILLAMVLGPPGFAIWMVKEIVFRGRD